jgi:2-polyprenyl-3-methyl-5-hydroxy-6-metoxy-1,4-benzoquinol methylase
MINYNPYDYSISIFDKYILALQAYTNLPLKEIERLGSNLLHDKFTDKFTNKIIKSYKLTKQVYIKSDHYMFRNPFYYNGKEYYTFQTYVDKILPDTGKILDYGCGAGVFDEYALRKGVRNITLVDLPSKTWKFVKFFFADRVEYEEDVENIKGKYKWIVATDVLEHLHDPIKVIKMWKEHLLPKGKILVSIAKDIGHEHLAVAINKYDKIMSLISKINE